MPTELDDNFFYLNKCPETEQFEKNIKQCDKLCCEPKIHYKELEGQKIPYNFLSENNNSSEALIISQDFAQEHNLPKNQLIFKKKHYCQCSIFRKERHHCFIKNPYMTFEAATGQVSSVTNKQCIKFNCSSLQSKKNIPKNYILIRQIVLWTEDQLNRLFEPSIIRTHLRAEHLGNITLCLSHLSEFDQLYFWINGCLRDQISLCTDKLIKSISKRGLQQKLPSEIPSVLVSEQDPEPICVNESPLVLTNQPSETPWVLVLAQEENQGFTVINQLVDLGSASSSKPSEIPDVLELAQTQDQETLCENQLVDLGSASTSKPNQILDVLDLAQTQDQEAVCENQFEDIVLASTNGEFQELIAIPQSSILTSNNLDTRSKLPLLDFDLSFLSTENNSVCETASQNGPIYNLLHLTTAANTYQTQFTYIAHSSFSCFLKINNQSKAITTFYLSHLSREAILNYEIDLIEYYMNEQASHVNFLSSQRQAITCNEVGLELECLAAVILDEIGVGYQQINIMESIKGFIASQT